MGFEPKHPGWEQRVRESFARQAMMATIAASLVRVAPGEVDIALTVSPAVCQQHGFVHGGAIAAIGDTACGYAALSLMPAGTGILTAEFKVNLLAPAAGETLLAAGRVVKPGRLLTVAQAEVHALRAGERKLVATLTATLVSLEGRDGVSD